MAVCELHEDIKNTVRDHERRIVALEKSDAEFAIRMENLIEKIDKDKGPCH